MTLKDDFFEIYLYNLNVLILKIYAIQFQIHENPLLNALQFTNHKNNKNVHSRILKTSEVENDVKNKLIFAQIIYEPYAEETQSRYYANNQ